MYVIFQQCNVNKSGFKINKKGFLFLKMEKTSRIKSGKKLVNPVFYLQTKGEDDKLITNGIIKIVRRTGQLNLSNRGLAHLPDKMFNMYDIDKNVMVDYNLLNSDSEETNHQWWTFTPLNYLDLSSNTISELPTKIIVFEDLTVLNLQDNCLTALLPEIGALKKLKKLNLSRNKIKELPIEFYRLTELQSLSLAYNELTEIFADIGDLIMLNTLDLSNNKLISLPSGIGFLVRLTEVNFSNNKLTEIPPDIVSLRALKKLDVTHNDIKFLPYLGEMRKLEILYAQHNNIEIIPNFEGCESLSEVYFGNNFIKEIPVEFCESLPHLKVFDLKDNKIDKLPDEIAMLQSLIRLDLTNNDLTNLPSSLGLLTRLQNIQMEGNKLKQIRIDIIKGGTFKILKHLREKLNEENSPKCKDENFMKTIPISTFPDKYTMRNGRFLNLALQNLTGVPENVFKEAEEVEVTVIDLSSNKLSRVPDGLRIVANNVTELKLCKNQLSSVPDFLSNFKRLQYLDLGNNLLDDLPECLGDLKELRELVLCYNKFSKLPDCVYHMENLEILLADTNSITEINVDGLSKLKRIANLNLMNNSISNVPPELGNLKQLRSLELKGNSFRIPRYSILEQGTESILSYLRNRIPQSSS